jgi:drug/metabolite transporter (DMT)-like permease
MIVLAPYIGPAAGVATSLLWTATSLFFTAAGKRIGPTAVNAARIVLAIALHAVTFRLVGGAWFPNAAQGQVLYLAASGIIGLSIGDQALFTAFVEIGPRLSMLIMTTAPLFAALFGWLVLDETLGLLACFGILLTIGGVAWVVMERPPATAAGPAPHRLRGVFFAFVGAACQAGGLLLSKQGMGHGWLPEDQHISPQAATYVRLIFAGIGVLPIVVVHAQRERRRRLVGVLPVRIGRRHTGLMLAACGAVVGPFLGVWMSLVASDRAPLAVAQTLCSLSPIFLLPFAATLHKEHIGPRAILGAVIAVAGSALLFVHP